MHISLLLLVLLLKVGAAVATAAVVDAAQSRLQFDEHCSAALRCSTDCQGNPHTHRHLPACPYTGNIVYLVKLLFLLWAAFGMSRGGRIWTAGARYYDNISSEIDGKRLLKSDSRKGKVGSRKQREREVAALKVAEYSSV